MSPSKLFLYNFIMIFIPQTRLFGFKRLLLRWCGAHLGDNVRIASSARFNLTGNLIIGNESWIGYEVLIVGGDAEVRIGANCDIAPRVTLVTGSHEIDLKGPKAAGEGYSLPIVIKDGCWVCTGSTVLGGTVLGEHCIVAAGAVVKNCFNNYSVVGGLPAKLLRINGAHNDGK